MGRSPDAPPPPPPDQPRPSRIPVLVSYATNRISQTPVFNSTVRVSQTPVSSPASRIPVPVSNKGKFKGLWTVEA